MAEIQWFPGHMARTNRELFQSVKIADIIIEILDARIPVSSGNPDFSELFRGKRRLVLLNKSDLADLDVSNEWKRYFRSLGVDAFFINAREGKGLLAILNFLKAVRAEKIEKQSEKGVVARPVRAIIAGIPNSGKSSLINRLSKSAPAVTGDRPGVTRRRQWFKVGDGIELLDTPGILWPKFSDETVGLHLAYTGAIKDDIYDIVEVAGKLTRELYGIYPEHMNKRYGTDDTNNKKRIYNAGNSSMDTGIGILEGIGRRRGHLLRGGEIDLSRTAAMLLDEFRAGKIGNITLERPTD